VIKDKILVTGANGMLGRAVVRQFKAAQIEVEELTRAKVDLVDIYKTQSYFRKISPSLIVHCAAAVGGIKSSLANGSRYFIENTRIDQSVLISAKEVKVPKLIYVASSCMYPANVEHALKEEEVLSGPLEPTNEDYAISKIAGSRLTMAISKEEKLDWKVYVPSNLFGPYDNFDLNHGHLLASIIAKSIEAKHINSPYLEMWGSGTPKREFTHVDDFARWILESSNFLEKVPPILNVGYGKDFTVQEFYEKVLTSLDCSAQIIPNLRMPNGNMRKLMDSSIANSLGWSPKIDIDEGIESTIKWFIENRSGI